MENKIPVVSSDPFCPVADCTECEIKPCPFDRQYAERLKNAQAAYGEAEKALRIAEENLRMVVIHG